MVSVFLFLSRLGAVSPLNQLKGIVFVPKLTRKTLSRYRRLVGKLNYLTITRPDISYAVSVVSQFLEAPSVPHWDAVTRIVRYLKRAPGLGILYRRNGNLRVEGFTDADWALQIEDLLQGIVRS